MLAFQVHITPDHDWLEAYEEVHVSPESEDDTRQKVLTNGADPPPSLGICVQPAGTELVLALALVKMATSRSCA
jgi:hypothetical protein